MLNTYTAGCRHIGLDSLRFLQHVGVILCITNEITQDTVFQVLFRRGRPSYHEHQPTGLNLLVYLLQDDVFHDHINDPSNKGLRAIHYAVIHVCTEAAELLLQRGVMVNLETAATDSVARKDKSAARWTTLDFAVSSYIHGAPQGVKFGGSTEIRAWKERLERLVRLLVANGSTNGSNAPGLYEIYAKKIVDPSKWKMLMFKTPVSLI